MERVQAGSHLHGLHLIHGLASSIECASQLQWWATVGISILANQVLHLLGVDERSGVGMLLGDDGLVVLEAILGNHRLYLLMRARRNLINHRPRISYLAAVLHIVEEALLHDTVLHPALGIGEDTSLHMVAVVRAVVGALQSDRQLASLVALIEECGELAHSKDCVETTSQVSLIECISLLGNSESDHLERWSLEDFHQSSPVVGKLLVCLQALGDGAEHLLLDSAIALQADKEGEIMVWAISLVDDFVVEALGDDDTTVVLTGVESVVEDSGRESTEDVSSAKVNPSRLIVSLLGYSCDVVLRKLITFSLPLHSIEIV